MVFLEGDIVWSGTFGLGRVESATPGPDYPIYVKFNSETSDGIHKYFKSDGTSIDNSSYIIRTFTNAGAYIPQDNDVIIYTCGRKRVWCTTKAVAIDGTLSDNVSCLTLNKQIENGDVDRITRLGTVIYRKKMNSFPELKSGMRVRLRNGEILIIAYNGKSFYGYNLNGEMNPFKGYNLKTGKSKIKNFDIVNVYDQFKDEIIPYMPSYESLIWEEPKVIILTLEEIEQKLGYAPGTLRVKS